MIVFIYYIYIHMIVYVCVCVYRWTKNICWFVDVKKLPAHPGIASSNHRPIQGKADVCKPYFCHQLGSMIPQCEAPQ